MKEHPKYSILFVWDRASNSNPVSPKRLPTHLFNRTTTKWTVVMQNPESKKFPASLQYRLFTSIAFRNMKPASREILILFYFEVNFKKYSSRDRLQPINDKHLILPYREIGERLGYSDKTIWTAIQDILAHGFLNIVEHGGLGKQQPTIYRISRQWRQWEPGKEIFKLLPSGRVGFQRKKRVLRIV